MKSLFEKKFSQVFFSYHLLNEFFVAFSGLLPFILRKELAASAFQISFFAMLKPAVALVSFYSSLRWLQRRPLRFRLLFSGLLARVPFLFFPFFNSISYLILASGCFMLFSRASLPSWMELLKQHVAKEKRERLFSQGMLLAYVENVFIAALIGFWFDREGLVWKWFCFFSALAGLLGVILQFRLFPNEKPTALPPVCKKPLKESWRLLKERKDFFYFQIGTMASGFALMLLAPALALFLADFLKLSYFDLTLGRYIFMGLGFVFFTPLWTKMLERFHILHLTAWICLGFALFSGLILVAFWVKNFFFLAFLVYGIFQAGSYLVWHLSGPIFAGENQDSTQYTALNVLMVGFRGLLAPLLGGLLCEKLGPLFVFTLAALISFAGAFAMVWARKNLKRKAAAA
ncbi:MAG: MFS transporter [Parachlamydiales bacterium]